MVPYLEGGQSPWVVRGWGGERSSLKVDLVHPQGCFHLNLLEVIWFFCMYFQKSTEKTKSTHVSKRKCASCRDSLGEAWTKVLCKECIEKGNLNSSLGWQLL